MVELPRLGVSAVVCAYNEERNLPQLLEALVGARGDSFDLTEVLVVASGCTDRTVELLTRACHRDPRIRLIIQPKREGKAAALAVGFARAREDILLVENADTTPSTGSLEHLLRPMHESDVTLVCSHPVAVNGFSTPAGRMGRVLWEIHDYLSRISPKVGEAFAIRRSHAFVPANVEDDDTFVGAYAASKGGVRRYVPEAVIWNRVPESLSELFAQRLRINRQVAHLARREGILSEAWEPKPLARAVLGYLRIHPTRLPECVALASLEATCRVLAALDSVLWPRRLTTWNPASSTKGAIRAGGVDD